VPHAGGDQSRASDFLRTASARLGYARIPSPPANDGRHAWHHGWQPSMNEVTPSDSSACSDEEWLLGVLNRLRDEGLPVRTASEPLAPVTREWRPSEHQTPPRPSVAVLRRHPELTFAFAKLPPSKVMRHRAPFGWGMKKEFTSQVMDRDVFAHSSLEFDALRSLELDGSVDNYIEQPFLLRYERDGRARFAKPDVLVCRGRNLECIDLKFEEDACLDEDKWRAIGQALASLDVAYSMMTERHVRRQPLYGNVKTVFANRHARPPREVALRALEAVNAAGCLTVGELGQRHGLTFEQACFLIRHGMLSTGLATAPLGPTSVIHWSNRCRGNPWRARK
jgi:hypothetical protein